MDMGKLGGGVCLTRPSRGLSRRQSFQQEDASLVRGRLSAGVLAVAGEFFHTNWTGRGGNTSSSTYNA